MSPSTNYTKVKADTNNRLNKFIWDANIFPLSRFQRLTYSNTTFYLCYVLHTQNYKTTVSLTSNLSTVMVLKSKRFLLLLQLPELILCLLCPTLENLQFTHYLCTWFHYQAPRPSNTQHLKHFSLSIFPPKFYTNHAVIISSTRMYTKITKHKKNNAIKFVKFFPPLFQFSVWSCKACNRLITQWKEQFKTLK